MTDVRPLQVADALVERYVGLIVEHQPTEATALGDHSRDGDLPDLSVGGVESFTRDVHGLLDDVTAALGRPELQAPTGDAREARGDLTLLEDDLRARSFWLTERPSLQLDPMASIGVASSGLHELLRRVELPGASDKQALVTAAMARARQLPRLFEQAGKLLESSPAPHLQVALQRCRGLVPLLRDELPRHAGAVGLSGADAKAAGEEGIHGVEAYAALLDELSDRPSAPWRLGPDHHAVALQAVLGTDLEADEIARRADAALTEARTELIEIAGSHWDELLGARVERPENDEAMLVAVLDAIAGDRAVDRQLLAAEASNAVADARAFAVESGLTDVPPAELLTVAEVPGFLQGVAVAFISGAPPLDPEVGCTYYLSPVPGHWDDQAATSFLREYNGAALRSLAIHEAYPGHFVQLAHAGRHPRLARRLLFSSAFAEGWAVYIERIAAEHGFGDLDYRITQLKVALRVAANALLDVSMHTGEMSDDEAHAVLMQRALQEELEASGKVTRAKVTAGQLSSYFVGGVEMADLRRDEEARLGADFDEVAFHHRVLSHGTPTTAMLREALADPDAEVRRPFA